MGEKERKGEIGRKGKERIHIFIYITEERKYIFPIHLRIIATHLFLFTLAGCRCYWIFVSPIDGGYILTQLIMLFVGIHYSHG